MSKLARSIVVLLVFAIAAAAQSSAQDWNVVKALAPGTEVRVTSARDVRGTLQSASDDSLIVNSGKGLETITRQEIVRVSLRKRGHRARNVLIGLAIGAGAGAGIGAATATAGCKNSGNCILLYPKGETAGIGAGVLGAIGALVGAVIPTGGWRDGYRK
jgi:hypothetical protein